MNMQVLSFEDAAELEQYFENQTEDATDAIIEGIEEAFNEGKSTAAVYRVSMKDSKVSYEVTLPKKQWETSIEQCIKYYQRIESFDKLIDSWTLLQRITKDDK